MLRRIRLVTLLAALAACVTVGTSFAQTAPYSASWVMISGTSATGTDVQIEIRENDGATVIGTGGLAGIAPANTASIVRGVLEVSWTDPTGGIYLVPNANPTKIDILDDLDRNFRIYIRPAAGAYSEVTVGGTVIDGVTYAQVMGVSTGVPTLSEWGFLFLVALMLGSGVWMLRNRNTPGLA